MISALVVFMSCVISWGNFVRYKDDGRTLRWLSLVVSSVITGLFASLALHEIPEFIR